MLQHENHGLCGCMTGPETKVSCSTYPKSFRLLRNRPLRQMFIKDTKNNFDNKYVAVVKRYFLRQPFREQSPQSSNL